MYVCTTKSPGDPGRAVKRCSTDHPWAPPDVPRPSCTHVTMPPVPCEKCLKDHACFCNAAGLQSLVRACPMHHLAFQLCRQDLSSFEEVPMPKTQHPAHRTERAPRPGKRAGRRRLALLRQQQKTRTTPATHPHHLRQAHTHTSQKYGRASGRVASRMLVWLPPNTLSR